MAKPIVLGFGKAEISIFDNAAGNAPQTADGTKVIKVNNVEGQGAAQELKIDGLTGETKKQYGNNGVAYVSAKAVGDVKVTFTALGMDDKEKMALVGAKNHEDKIFNVSSDDKVPNCALWFEAPTDNGKTACIGIYKAKASLGDIAWQTMEDGAYEPKGEELTFATETDGREGLENSYYVKAILDKDGADKAMYKGLRDKVLRITDASLATHSLSDEVEEPKSRSKK